MVCTFAGVTSDMEDCELKEATDRIKLYYPDGEWRAALWDALVISQGEKFTTAGRGNKRAGVDFTYEIKISNKTGMPTDELVISRKEQSKTITRSTVNMAFENAVAVQKEEGCVKGPKRLNVFGASYLYAIFVSWGIITKDER